ncbi:MAG: O-antigen ligase family protein, partial [Deltaproteobacteria bacterium]
MLTPLAYVPALWHGFEAGKGWYLQIVVGLAFPAWVALAWRRPEYRPTWTLVSLGVAANLTAIALSLPAAYDWHLGFWGSTDKMNGLVTHLHLAAWFLMAVSLFRTQESWRRVLQVVIACSVVSAAVAIGQLWVPDILGSAADIRLTGLAGNPGLLGNPVFLGAYHVHAIFLLAFAWARAGASERAGNAWWWAAGLGLSVAAIVVAGSRGSLLALAVGLASAALAFSYFSGRRRLVAGIGGLLAAAGGSYLTAVKLAVPAPGLAAFWLRHPALRHLFEFSDDSGRLDTLRMTLPGIRARPLLGWGQGNYENLFDHHYAPME